MMSCFVKFSVVENTTSFFQSWFIDLRDFTFLFGKEIQEMPNKNIKVFDLKTQGTAFFSKQYQTDETFGYLTVDWSQDESNFEHVWITNTFLSLLASLGGYGTVLVSFFGLLIGNYQSFVYDKTMLKRLYFRQKVPY